MASHSAAVLHQGAPGQVTWLEDPPPWLRPVCCFASVIVWTENKNFTISNCWLLYLFYFDSETISAALVVFVFWGSSTFLRKTSASGWPGLRRFWPRNDLAPLLHWRHHRSHCVLPGRNTITNDLIFWLSVILHICPKTCVFSFASLLSSIRFWS